jgi:hypothetical protein
MNRLVATGGGLVGSYAGWALGALEGTMTAFILSIIGTALGIIAARRIVDRLSA